MTDPMVNGEPAAAAAGASSASAPASATAPDAPASKATNPANQSKSSKPSATTSAPSGDGAPAADSPGKRDAAGESNDNDTDTDDRPRRRRGSRGGRSRASGTGTGDDDRMPDELPDRPNQGKARPSDAAEAAIVRKPQIGDTRPAPAAEQDGDPSSAVSRAGAVGDPPAKTGNRRRRGGRGRGSGAGAGSEGQSRSGQAGARPSQGGESTKGQPRGGESRATGRSDQGGTNRGGRKPVIPIQAQMPDEPLALDDAEMKRRGGRERKGRPVGRYLMCVSVGPKATQIAVLEGRNLIEHYVARPSDDIAQIHGNIYLGKVQNVLPGMEAAFIDIGTPKNAVLYRGDVQYDAEDVEEKGNARIEQILKPRQTIVCQVTKNPIAHKGARLTQEVSLPGRFVVLIPNSTTYGISKRLPDNERKRLRNVLDKVRPKGHGLIVRTAAEGVTAEEIERDVLQLSQQWQQISALAAKTQSPALLYREPDMAVRVIREEFNQEYRGIVIDDPALYEEVRSYVNAISPALADRVQFYDESVEPLSMYERHHVHEQLHRALDRKVWLPSGGSLIIEHTEALTVVDVNTGKNVGSSSLEETVFRNNLEAAEEIAKQLRLRDIGGIIVIDFIDMEIEKNRREVIKLFRDSLARDKTRTQVFDISHLGLVEMTRKRIGEGLLESFSTQCPECAGRGFTLDQDLIV